jgi:hypothetical protein
MIVPFSCSAVQLFSVPDEESWREQDRTGQDGAEERQLALNP